MEFRFPITVGFANEPDAFDNWTVNVLGELNVPLTVYVTEGLPCSQNCKVETLVAIV